MGTDIRVPRWRLGNKPWARPAAGLVWLAVGVLSALWILSLVSAAFHSARIFDFAQEWTSVRNYLAGYPVYLDFGRSLEIHLGGPASPLFSYNAHPPAAVLLALPFGMLEYPTAYLAWTIFSLICFVISSWAIVRFGGRGRFGMDALALLALVVSGNAFAHQMVQGQLNLVVLLLITGAWVADRKHAAASSGALIGLAAGFKLFPAFLILYPLARRNWRAVWGAALAFLAVNGVAWSLFRTQAYLDYFLRVAPDVTKFRDALPNASLLGFWSKLFDGSFGEVLPLWHAPLLAKTLAVLSGLLLAAATFWMMDRISRRSVAAESRDTDRGLSFALCCAGMLLASPITWDHYFLLLIPGVWLAWRATSGRAGVRTLIVVLAVALLWLNPYSLWETFLPERYASNGQVQAVRPADVLTLVSFQFYALLGFYLLICVEICRQLTGSNSAVPADEP